MSIHSLVSPEVLLERGLHYVQHAHRQNCIVCKCWSLDPEERIYGVREYGGRVESKRVF